MDKIEFNKQHFLYKEDIQNVINSIDVKVFEKKKILITGATGLIGTFLIDVLMFLKVDKGVDIEIFALSRSKNRALKRLGEYFDDEMFHFLEQDIKDELPDIQLDYIIHGASNAHPLSYASDPVGTIMTNINGTLNVLSKARDCGAQVVFLSTVEIYGENKEDIKLFSENDTGFLNLNTARSCYPESKRTSEALCQSFYVQYGVRVKILRLCRIFGPTMIEADSKASAQFLKNAKKGENIILKSEGNQYFSYCYVADAVSAILYVMDKGRDCFPYNLANVDCNIHLKDFAELVAKTCGRQVGFDLPTDAEKEGFSGSTVALLNNNRLLHLGWKPYYKIEDAILRTIKILY